ncbi:dTDP-glucose 4,6-dehydratase [Acetoanaerobium pronyense]|uniref:dTDP-glucose 4,6-dehydratase n=1 Tax=Acetoanaerobium pronyense TaxID=1482736 RepID=A0ABS4KJ19_9FIRM|nr:dTDP-glucose 4,6-dehydratase [Acetoanaerobium pronyense]
MLCNNNEILLYDNLNRNSIKSTNLLNHKNVKLIQGDILDYESVKSAIKEFQPNIVIHLAAVAGIDTVIKSPVNTMKVNMIGTYNLLEALKDNMNSLERVIDFSTSEVFGSYAYKVNEMNTTNLAPVGEARWTYSVSKLAAEHLSHSYYKEYGMPVITVRPFNIYGPGQVGEGAIHQFVVRAISDEQIQIHGEGDQIRSWCYVDDFMQGIMLCLEKEEAIGQSFNIGNPRATVTIAMLAETIKRISNSNSEIKYVSKNYVDVELRIPSIEKAKELLGFKPSYDLIEGLTKTIEWYRGVNND